MGVCPGPVNRKNRFSRENSVEKRFFVQKSLLFCPAVRRREERSQLIRLVGRKPPSTCRQAPVM